MTNSITPPDVERWWLVVAAGLVVFMVQLDTVATLAPLGGISGPALGGLLVEQWGWSAIFLVNLPVAALVLAVVRWRAPAGGVLRGPGPGSASDVLLLGGAATALLVGQTPISDGQLASWWLIPLGLGLGTAWWHTDSSRGLRQLLASTAVRAVHGAFVGTYFAVLTLQFLGPFFLSMTPPSARSRPALQNVGA